MTAPSEPGQQRAVRTIWGKIAIGIAIVVGVVVIGSVILVVWAIAKGEEQLHHETDRRRQKPTRRHPALKRYLARHLYRLLQQQPQMT